MSDDVADITVEGSGRSKLWAWPFVALASVTGALFIKWLFVLVFRHILGYSKSVRLSFNGRRLRMQSTTRCFGRTIRERDEFILSRDMLTVGIEKKFPFLPLLAGFLGVLIGAWVGLDWILDSIQAEYAAIGAAGAGVITAGVLLDIIFGAVSDYLGSRDSILVTLGTGHILRPSRGVRVVGVDSEAAHQCLMRLSELSP